MILSLASIPKTCAEQGGHSELELYKRWKNGWPSPPRKDAEPVSRKLWRVRIGQDAGFFSIDAWCNGSTSDSGSLSGSSSLSASTNPGDWCNGSTSDFGSESNRFESFIPNKFQQFCIIFMYSENDAKLLKINTDGACSLIGRAPHCGCGLCEFDSHCAPDATQSGQVGKARVCKTLIGSSSLPFESGCSR